MTTFSSRNSKIGLLLAMLLLVGGVAVYGFAEYSWFRNAGDVSAEPRLPEKPFDASDELKEYYGAAIAAHEAREADPTYVRFLEEGLAWKTVGEFAADTEKRTYLGYSAFVYGKAAEAFPTEWVPYLNVGNLFTQMGEFGRAEQAYKKAAEIAPERGEVLIAMMEMLQAAKGTPTPDLLEYMQARLPGLQFDGGQFVLLYADFLLKAGFNAEALAALRVGAETFVGDTRVAAEYKAVRAELEKRGYKEEVKVD
jgi:tetratricopeptide (TPR) repeat protein